MISPDAQLGCPRAMGGAVGADKRWLYTLSTCENCANSHGSLDLRGR